MAVQKIKILVYPVSDLEKAKTFYSKYLNVKPYVDSPSYVGYKVGTLEIGLDPNSKSGPISYIDVIDIKVSLEEMTKVGAEIVQDAHDVGGGLLVAQIKDLNGNIIGFRQLQ